MVLANGAPGRSSLDPSGLPADAVRLGFACHWGPHVESTWSGTPWHLRLALERHVRLVDLGVQFGGLTRDALRVAGARYTSGGWVSTWRQSAPTSSLVERRIRRDVKFRKPEVVLQVQDLAALAVPNLVLQDLSYGLLLEHFGPDGVPHFRALGLRRIERLHRRQVSVYEQAAGLLPMSRWMARSVVADGVPAERVRVINPGVNVPLADNAPVPERRQGSTRRLLMVGRDFDTKGGAQLVAAFRLLRRHDGPRITLTIVGPTRWPLRGDVPEGVDFLGPQPLEAVGTLLDSHDLFVMPSRFEGFGIAFVEALVRGLPCIGRDACAMPEIIDPVNGGRLVRSESPAELAELVLATLDDDDLYAACAIAAPGRRLHFTWDRAASEVSEVARSVR